MCKKKIDASLVRWQIFWTRSKNYLVRLIDLLLTCRCHLGDALVDALWSTRLTCYGHLLVAFHGHLVDTQWTPWSPSSRWPGRHQVDPTSIVRNDFLVPPFYKKFPLSGRFPLSKTCPGSGNCDMSDRSRRAGMVHQSLLGNQLDQWIWVKPALDNTS